MDFEKGTQLKGYIQREIKNNPMHSNYGYNYYFCRNFLQRLFDTNDKFILKGSISQFTNLRTLIRPITDIDIVTPDNIEQANNTILSLTTSNDKISYKIKQKFVTTNATINYRIICKLDNIEHLITIDLRKENELEKQTKELPTLFSKDNSFNINTISLEEHLSNKLYISILNLQLNQKLGKEFRRFKDFYDIYKIMSLGNIDEKKVSDFLQHKIKQDQFLDEYSLQGNLFTKAFIDENQKTWELNKQAYEFDKNTSFEQAVEVTNETIIKTRK